MKWKQILDYRWCSVWFGMKTNKWFYLFFLQGTLDSVNQLAAQTYSAFNKEGTGSRESLTSLASQLSLNTLTASDNGDNNGVAGSSSDLVSFGSPAAAVTAGVTAGGSSSSSGQFFSLGEDDDPVSLSNANSPTKTPTPLNNSGKVIGKLISIQYNYCWT